MSSGSVSNYEIEEKKNNKIIKRIVIVLLTVLSIGLILTTTAGLALDKKNYSNKFIQYTVNLCDFNDCPPNYSINSASLINKTNEILLPLCENNIINSSCVVLDTSFNNGQICDIICNRTNCNLINCFKILNCINNIEFSHKYDNNVTTLISKNISIIINESQIYSNNFNNNYFCIEYKQNSQKVFRIYNQTVNYSLKDIDSSCIISKNNLTYTAKYKYEMIDLITNNISCDAPLFFLCEHKKSIINAECRSINQYQLSKIIYVLIWLFGMFLGLTLGYALWKITFYYCYKCQYDD